MKHILSTTTLAVSMVWLCAPSASATTLSSTRLSDVVQVSQAVVHGELVEKRTLITEAQVPWTIYTLDVYEVLAGQVTSQRLSFRCIGGTVNSHTLVMEGTPRLAVGDEIVVFLHAGGLCQLSGLEHGVLWLRENSVGDKLIVDSFDRVLAGLDGHRPLLSAQHLPRPGAQADDTPISHSFSLDQLDANLESVNQSDLPPAPSSTLLEELRAFSTAYLRSFEELYSTEDLSELPSFGPEPMPEPPEKESKP